MNPTLKRCTNCILPETVPGIKFDNTGICNFCTSYRKPEYKGEEALKELLDTHITGSGKYDCIVPVSGGRDSTYVLWYAKKELGLRILAVMGDNEFRHPQADINIQRACDILGVDFISYRSKKNYGHKIVKNRIQAGIQLGSKGMDAKGLLSISFCHACVTVARSAIYIQAEKYQVPLIFRGDSIPEHHKYHVDSNISIGRSWNARLRRAMTLSYIKNRYYSALLRNEYPVPGNTRFSRTRPVLKNPNIKEVSLFDYIEWNRHKIKQTLSTELGWEKPKEAVSSWRFDCTIGHLVDYSFLHVFGITKSGMGYSNMINAGQMTRDEALEQEEHRIEAINQNLQGLLEDVGLSKKEIDTIYSFQKEPFVSSTNSSFKIMSFKSNS